MDRAAARGHLDFTEAEAVLALQRLAGNAAVSLRIGALVAPSSHQAGTLTLQRHASNGTSCSAA